MSDSEIPNSNWTKEQLMGPYNATTLESMKKDNPDLWGRPGYLTEEEAKTYVSRQRADSREGKRERYSSPLTLTLCSFSHSYDPINE